MVASKVSQFKNSAGKTVVVTFADAGLVNPTIAERANARNEIRNVRKRAKDGDAKAQEQIASFADRSLERQNRRSQAGVSSDVKSMMKSGEAVDVNGLKVTYDKENKTFPKEMSGRINKAVYKDGKPQDWMSKKPAFKLDGFTDSNFAPSSGIGEFLVRAKGERIFRGKEAYSVTRVNPPSKQFTRGSLSVKGLGGEKRQLDLGRVASSIGSSIKGVTGEQQQRNVNIGSPYYFPSLGIKIPQ